MPKKALFIFILLCIAGNIYSDEQMNIDLQTYVSTQGMILLFFNPQWSFPFLMGESSLTSGNNIALGLNGSISPISAWLTGDIRLSVTPFLSFTLGGQVGTGWNYDLFDRVSLIGLGLNQKTNADDPNEDVIGKGMDGVVWNINAGTTFQLSLSAFFPGEWNRVVLRICNEIEYFAYSKAHGIDLWYWLHDDGMNQNAFRYNFSFYLGYIMPIFIEMAGLQFSGSLPFYNVEADENISDIGYSFTAALLAHFRINERFMIRTVAQITNDLIKPVTSAYERKWGFDNAHLVFVWRIK